MREITYFLELLELAVELYSIRIFSYSVLTTHFHLLVCCPLGNLDRAMAYIQARYVQRFNLPRGRDGALFKGRYWSRPVRGHSDRIAVARYIDGNAVKARLVASPWEYPWSSAWHFRRGSRPPWLDATWIEESVVGAGIQSRPGASYPPWPESSRAGDWLVERRSIARGLEGIDLLRAASGEILAWLRANSQVADGRSPRWPIAAPIRVRAAIGSREIAQPSLHLESVAVRRPIVVWRILEAGLLRDACGLTNGELSLALDAGPSALLRLRRAHEDLLGSSETYAALAEGVIRESAEGILS
jgi:hypothetical protein